MRSSTQQINVTPETNETTKAMHIALFSLRAEKLNIEGVNKDRLNATLKNLLSAKADSELGTITLCEELNPHFVCGIQNIINKDSQPFHPMLGLIGAFYNELRVYPETQDVVDVLVDIYNSVYLSTDLDKTDVRIANWLTQCRINEIFEFNSNSNNYVPKCVSVNNDSFVISFEASVLGNDYQNGEFTLAIPSKRIWKTHSIIDAIKTFEESLTKYAYNEPIESIMEAIDVPRYDVDYFVENIKNGNVDIESPKALANEKDDTWNEACQRIQKVVRQIADDFSKNKKQITELVQLQNLQW